MHILNGNLNVIFKINNSFLLLLILEIVKKSIAERFKQRLYNMLFSGITVEKFYPWKKKGKLQLVWSAY